MKKNIRAYSVEVCVDSLSSARYAVRAGADQIELCSRLDLDGLFPGAALIKACQKELNTHIKVMIRPRSGGFDYNKGEMEEMYKQIDLCRVLGIHEIVLGVIDSGRPDLLRLADLAGHAENMKITFHKAIDATENPLESLSQLLAHGVVSSILTSGGKKTAREGTPIIKEMIALAGTKCTIIPAGSILPGNIDQLHKIVDAKVYHGRNILRLKPS